MTISRGGYHSKILRLHSGTFACSIGRSQRRHPCRNDLSLGCNGVLFAIAFTEALSYTFASGEILDDYKVKIRD